MSKVFIIAEAGVNHNGEFAIAKQLIDAAAETGADAIKFQTFQAKNLVTKYADKACYQKQTTDATESQFAMIQKLELSYEDHVSLYEYAQQKGGTVEAVLASFVTAMNLANSTFEREVGVRVRLIEN